MSAEWSSRAHDPLLDTSLVLSTDASGRNESKVDSTDRTMF